MADQFQFLTPEMAQQLANTSFAPEEQERLEKQLQEAIALRKGGAPTYSTPGAAAIGGVGHLIDTISSNAKEGQLRDQQSQLMATQKGAAAEYLRAQQAQETQKNQLMQAYIDALRGKGAAAQPGQPAQPAGMSQQEQMYGVAPGGGGGQ